MKYFFIVIAFMSVLAFILYGVDKRRAIKRRWRIKEATLLFVGFFGGSVGALLAMLLFRHKTLHKAFLITVPVFLLLWMIVLAVLCYFS
jgi:uncharacterized membrane protein YsdA (DUF1294 family)